MTKMSKYSYKPLPMQDPDTVHEASAFSYTPQSKFGSIYTYNKAYEHHVLDVTTEPPSAFNKICSALVAFMFYVLVFITLPISGWFSFRKVQSHERLVIFRLGRLLGSKGPGLVLVLPCIDRRKTVDLRPKAFSVPPQKVITSDGAVIEIGADVYFTVKDAIKSIVKIQDLNHSLRVLCHTAIPNHLGKRKVSEIEQDRNSVNYSLSDDINSTTTSWGVQVDKVELSHPKIIQKDNPLITGAQANPLQALGQVLFPPGSSGGGSGMNQLQQLAQLAPSLMQQMSGGQASQGAVQQQLQMDYQQYVSQQKAHRTSGPSLTINRIVTPKELVAATKNILNETIVQEFGCVFLFEVYGENGGSFYLDLKNGRGAVGEGPPPTDDLDVTVNVNSVDLQSMLSGDLSPFNAYMSGLIQVSGDLRSAMQLGELVDRIKSQL